MLESQKQAMVAGGPVSKSATRDRTAEIDWSIVDEAVRRVEEAWRNSGDFDLRQAIPISSGETRLRAIAEGIKVDQEYRRKRRNPKPLEDYLAEWKPELGVRPDLQTELLVAECLVRVISGDSPTEAELQQRFPDLAARVDLSAIGSEARRECGDRGASGAASDKGSGFSPAAWSLVSGEPSRLQPGDRFGRFVIREQIGAGGMGTVYRAWDSHPQLPREVALKIPRLNPGFDHVLVERFLREAQSAGSLQHPHICTVFEAGEHGGVPYLVMPLIEGQSLKDWQAGRPLDPEEAIRIVGQLAEALQLAHNRGIVHRDIKPSNIMMDGSGRPLLMDFGLARLVQSEPSGEREAEAAIVAATPPLADTAMLGSTAPERCRSFVTATGDLLGTLPYMSLEQLEGRRVDRRSDLYSLGVVLYELLTGERPFPDCERAQDMRVVLQKFAPPRPSSVRPGLHPSLDAVCTKAMARASERRFATAAEFASALDECRGEAARRATRRYWTRLALRVAGIAAVVILAAGLAWYTHAATGQGMITVIISEPGTTKTLDGKEVSVEDVPEGEKIRVPVGRHRLEVSKPGFQTHAEELTIRWRGGAAEVRVEMKTRESARVSAGSYLGGTTTDQVITLAVDGQGNQWLLGLTDSHDLPGRQNEYEANGDAFVARIDSQHRLQWTRYLGDSGYNEGTGIAVNQRGDAYVSGWSQPFQGDVSAAAIAAGRGQTDAFVQKLSATGEPGPIQFLGGSQDDRALAIALTLDGHVLVVGFTNSEDFGDVPPAQKGRGPNDAFLAKLTPELNIVWVHLFGGRDADRAASVVIDGDGQILLCGDTSSDDLMGSLNAYRGGERDGFLAKFDADGQLAWSRYVGGRGRDVATGLTTDRAGQVWVGGWTASDDFPASTSLRVTRGGGRDAFAARYDVRGEPGPAIVLGGSDDDEAMGISADRAGNVYVAGRSRSVDFPTAGGVSRQLKGNCDGFLAKLDADGQLLASGFVGGSQTDVLRAVQATAGGEAVVAGWTDSPDFPTPQAFAGQVSGGLDGLLARVSNQSDPKVLPPPRQISVLWEREFAPHLGEQVRRVKLSPDGQHLVVFHYTGTSLAWVSKLDVRTGDVRWQECADLKNHRGTNSGWIDQAGNLYLSSAHGYPGPRDGGFHLWKYDPQLKRQLWSYQGAQGLECVENILTDAKGNVYATGHSGSWIGKGSACAKLTADGRQLWEVCCGPYGNGGDDYAAAMALDADGNLYRVGHDDYLYEDKKSWFDRFGGFLAGMAGMGELAKSEDKSCLDTCGRLLVHRAADGQVLVNRTLDEIRRLPPRPMAATMGGSIFGGVLIDIEGHIWVVATTDLYFPRFAPSKREETLLLKLDRNGNLLKQFVFPGANTYARRQALIWHSDQSFYVAYQRRIDGAVYPALAEVGFDGTRRWHGVIPKRGWDLSYGGCDAGRGKIYVPLVDPAEWPFKTCVVAVDATAPADVP